MPGVQGDKGDKGDVGDPGTNVSKFLYTVTSHGL